MITFIRTLTYAPGKGDQVLALARQSRRLVKKRFGLDIQIRAPIGGHPNRIAYVARFHDLAEFEALMLQLATDPDFRKLRAAHSGNIVDGASHDEIWRDIEIPGSEADGLAPSP